MAKTKIDYDTVVAATSGDALAAGAVLDYGIDLSMKSFMQAKLLRAMLRFKP